MNNMAYPEINHWKELHLELQDLLAGYLDNELDSQQITTVEAHLAGCADCRADLARQQLLCGHLEQLATEHLSKSARHNIEQAILAAEDLVSEPTTKPDSLSSKILGYMKKFVEKTITPARAVANSGWAVAAVLLVVILMPSAVTNHKLTATEIPMIDDVLAQYQQLQQRNLPISAADSTELNPVTWQDAVLLSSWNTNIGGKPAQVFAFLHQNKVVLQYKIAPGVFYRNAVVRNAIASQGIFETQTDNTDVMVIPAADFGLIMVGPSDSLPSKDNFPIRAI